MNVKPGDLAVILKSRKGHCSLVGMPCTVVRRAPTTEFELDGRFVTGTDNDHIDWVIELFAMSMDVSLCLQPIWTRYFVVTDHRLRPIRDPGDDARDEMLRPLPVKEVA